MSSYYGMTRGAVVRWSSTGSDRNPPEGAAWTLRFTPQHELRGSQRRALATQLHRLAVDCRRHARPLTEYLMRIDATIDAGAQP